MKFRFCPLCSERLVEKDLGDDKNVPFCEKCNRPFFPHSAPCVIVLPVTESGKAALTRQSYGDTEKFVLTAGFMGEGESAEETCARELFEELGLRAKKLTYLKSYGYEKRDTLMLGFEALVSEDDFCLSDEVREAKWVSLDEAEELLKNSTVAKMLLEEYRARQKNP